MRYPGSILETLQCDTIEDNQLSLLVHIEITRHKVSSEMLALRPNPLLEACLQNNFYFTS